MKLLLRVLERAHDGTCAIDGDQRIVLWNGSATRILGFDGKDVLGRRCCDVFGGIDDNGCSVCRADCPVVRMALSRRSVPTRVIHALTGSGGRRRIDVSTLVLPRQNRGRPVIAHQFRDAPGKTTPKPKCRGYAREPRIEPSIETTEAGSSTSPDPLACLSDREREVLTLLARGADTRSIAERLFISTATVRNHIAHILAKLRVHTRLGAVILAVARKGTVATSAVGRAAALLRRPRP